MRGEKYVHYDSDEAASYKTNLSGWVSRDGIYFGSNEHTARWSGCTHKTCETEGCEEVISKNSWTICKACKERSDKENYEKLPVKEWNGEDPIYSDSCDQYFFCLGSVLDYLEELQQPNFEQSVKSLRLVHCEPNYLSQVEVDHWCDDLPEDEYDLPNKVEEALEILNQAIREEGPVSWSPSKFKVNYEDFVSHTGDEI